MIKRKLAMDFAISAIWLALFYGILLFPVALFSVMHWSELLVIMTVIFTYFIFVRRVFKNIALMLIAHIVVPVAAWWLAPAVHLQIIFAIVATFFVFISLMLRSQIVASFAGQFPTGMALHLVIVGLLAAHYVPAISSVQYIILVIITGAGGRLYRRTYLTDVSLGDINKLSAQPTQKILAFDNKVVLATGAVVTGAIVLVGLILRPILSFLNQTIPRPLAGTSLPYGEPDAPLQIGHPAFAFLHARSRTATYTEPGRLWWLFEMSVTLTIIIGGILTVVALVKAFHHLFAQVKKDPVAPDADNDGEEKEFIQSPKLRGLWRRGPYNDNKLRKQFRETVVRHRKKGVPIVQSDTPNQMAVKIEADDISELAEAYAAIRYN